uniref:substrate-binding domain-containing protein n=1 Tax=Chamaesiphon sp. OTE_8_metabat_110 TaxID=2964696 RepID=UPI00286C5BEF
MKQQSSSIVTLALILAAGGTNLKAIAQTAADKFPLPASVASGTKVQLDGSSSMQAVNQGLKERFEKQFSGTNVTVPTQYQGSDSGVKAIAEDKADLAGIGRALTPAEKAQGITAKSIGRSKIAIIVKDGNPYQGNLTLSDFAKIYRGEVTDWSQLPSAKGAKGKIKVIDRPETSDTRRAFANYPVFQNGKLKTGRNAQKLTEDSTQAVVDKLGDDGIGYAPAEQIKDIKGIRAVTLHGTQPDNPKYPFSQPLAYAYKNKDGKTTEGTKAFLGYASAPDGQSAIKELLPSAVAAIAAPASSGAATTTTTETTTGTTGTTGATETTTPGTSTTTTETTTTTAAKPEKGGLPWWLILLPIGGLLLWLLGRKKPTDTVTTITPPPDVTTPGIKPLYPPPPTRTVRGEGLSGDLSGDLSSNLGGYRPSGDLRSGDLRSGDLSGTLPPRPNLDTQPNINFNGVVDSVKNKAGDMNLAGGAAIAGGAAAAAALGKGIFVGGASQNENRDGVAEIHPPANPEIDLSNPLEGLTDKSSNLMPDLDINNPLDGIKGKIGDSIDGVRGTDLNLEFPKVSLDGIPTRTGDLNPQGDNILDRVGDFLKDGGGAAIAGGGAVIAGGAALAGGAGKSVGDFFGGQKDLDLSEDLSLESANTNDPFNFGTP